MIYNTSDWEELLENKGFVDTSEVVNNILKKVYDNPNCELELWGFVKNFNFNTPEDQLGDSCPTSFLPLVKILHRAYRAKKARVKVAAGSSQAQYPSTGGGGGWSDDDPPTNFGGGGDRWGDFNSPSAPQPPKKRGPSVWRQIFLGVAVIVVGSFVVALLGSWAKGFFVADTTGSGPQTEVIVITATPSFTTPAPAPRQQVALPPVTTQTSGNEGFSPSSQGAVNDFMTVTKKIRTPFVGKIVFEADDQEISLPDWFGKYAFGSAKEALISFAEALVADPPDLAAARLALNQAQELEPELKLGGLVSFVSTVKDALRVPPTATPTVPPTFTPVPPTALPMVAVAKTVQVVVAPPTATPAPTVLPTATPVPLTAVASPILPTPVGTVGPMSLTPTAMPALPTSVRVQTLGSRFDFLAFMTVWGYSLSNYCTVLSDELFDCPSKGTVRVEWEGENFPFFPGYIVYPIECNGGDPFYQTLESKTFCLGGSGPRKF